MHLAAELSVSCGSVVAVPGMPNVRYHPIIYAQSATLSRGLLARAHGWRQLRHMSLTHGASTMRWLGGRNKPAGRILGDRQSRNRGV